MNRNNHYLNCVENMIEYCKFLEKKTDKGEWERGYRYGVQHIRQQLEKIVDNNWSDWTP